MIQSLYPVLQWKDFLYFINILKNPEPEFSKKLNDHFRFTYSMTFSSGRAAIFNILKSHNIENKDILITAYTCSVVTEAIVQSGNRPVFIDTGKGSFNACFTRKEIERHSSNLGAIVITNLFGITDFFPPEFLPEERDYLVILDDALSPGNVGEASDNNFDYVMISCGVRKPFSCLGGGIGFTNNRENFERLHDYMEKNRKSGRVTDKIKKFLLGFSFFFVFRPGIYNATAFIRRKTTILNPFFNEKEHDIFIQNPEYFEDMLPFQKRIGLVQVDKISSLLQYRSEIGNMYYACLENDYPIIKEYWRKNTPYSHIPFLHPQRDRLEKYLYDKGIDTERYFDYIVPWIKQYNCSGNFENSRLLAGQMINLPIHAGLQEEIIHRIVLCIKEFDEKFPESPLDPEDIKSM